MPDAKISDLPAGGDPQDTDAFVVARGAGVTNVSLAWSSLSNAATRNNVAVTLDGNTAGALALVSTGTLTLAGGNNITVSQAGNAVTISGPAAAGAQTGISGIANSQTTYTSGSVTLSELGAITIRSTTGQQFQFSVNPQTTQTQGILSAGVSTGGNTAGNTTVNTGSRLVLAGVGDISLSQATAAGASTISISGSQSVQTQGNLSMGVSTGGNTAGNTTVNTGSRFVLVASGNATASQATAAGASTVTLSVGTQTVQTQDVLSIGASTGGNTAGNTTVNTGSRFVVVASGDLTASQGTAAGATTLTLSAGTQSAQTQGILNAGVSTGGNTSGDTTVNSGTRLVFVGTNNITLSQGTAANATTITISGGAGGGATFSGGMSTMGNTSGDTGYATQRLNLVGGNNITLSGSTNAGSMSITISAPNLGAGAMSAGVSNLGNTAGSTGVTGTRLVLVGSSGISLSQSTDANGGTVSFNAAVPVTHSMFNTFQFAERVTSVISNATPLVQPYAIDRYVHHDRVILPVQYSQATNSTLTVTVSAWFGMYTRNVSTLSLASSTSGSFSINGSGTASSNQNSGLRNITFAWTNTLSPEDYWLVANIRTTTAGANASLSLIVGSQQNSNWSGLMGVASAISDQYVLGLGRFTASSVGVPNSVAFSDIAGSAGVNHRPPLIWFLSQSA